MYRLEVRDPDSPAVQRETFDDLTVAAARVEALAELGLPFVLRGPFGVVAES